MRHVFHRHFYVLTLFVAIGSWTASYADNWPRFRGPNGSGVAADKNIPVKWTKENFLWKKAIPGVGNSSPIVWGKKIFLQSATDKERMLICLDATTGEIVWNKTIHGSEAHTHEKNTYASCTPATDGERVYAVFWDGERVALFAYSLKGEFEWKYDLGKFKSQHGPGFSPMIAQGKVIVNNDQDKFAELVAVHAKTGKLAWRLERKAFRACYSTPFLLDRGKDKQELIVASTAGITGYDLEKGDENWFYKWSFPNSPLRTVGSPVTSNGLIFAGSGDGSGERHMIAVKIGTKGDVTQTNLAWKKTLEFPYVPSMLTRGEHLFFVNDLGVASCYQAEKGARVWKQRLQGNFSASPVLIDGKIFAVNEKGTVFVFPAEAKFKLLARNPLGETVRASPAVADGRFYIRGEKHLFCIGQKNATK